MSLSLVEGKEKLTRSIKKHNIYCLFWYLKDYLELLNWTRWFIIIWWRGILKFWLQHGNNKLLNPFICLWRQPGCNLVQSRLWFKYSTKTNPGPFLCFAPVQTGINQTLCMFITKFEICSIVILQKEFYLQKVHVFGSGYDPWTGFWLYTCAITSTNFSSRGLTLNFDENLIYILAVQWPALTFLARF